MEQPEDDAQMPTDLPEPDAPAGPSAANGQPLPAPSTDLAAVRELMLLAYPDLVPELVQGGTIAELQAAVAPAQAAYRQVAERIASGATAISPTTPPAVPAGAAGVLAPIDGLPPGELIKRALQRRG